MTWLFSILAALSFVGFGMQARRYNGHGMVYAATLFVLWVVLALLWSGRI